MSDPRFTRLKTDPRFRKIRKSDSKVVVDDRFKEIFEDDRKKKSKKNAKGRVDKYGRPIADEHEKDNLRRFYRLEDEEPAASTSTPDLARGEVLLESSDEDDAQPDSDGDENEVVTLGLHQSKPITVAEDEDNLEIDLDEDNFADLDAQAQAYADKSRDEDGEKPSIASTKRLAVVNLDWEHVKATHLYKIFSSLVSSSGPSKSSERKGVANGSSIVRGRVLNVRVYPSDFGRARMAREEREGPPSELFNTAKEIVDEDEINEKNIYEVGEENDYNEDALRKYQLERLRYYYAIAECDTADTAAHIYSELEGTELERSANVFDMSFVPDGMEFDQEFRDEASEEVNAQFKPLDFTTDALRHSKVKLTWDQDDPERNKFTRRTLSRKEIEEDDFRAYIASSSSEGEEDDSKQHSKKGAERDKLRSLLLGGSKDDLPEGWGKFNDDHTHGGTDDLDLDMEITFTPGLSGKKNDGDETTLEKYQRKLKEKRKKRKEESKSKEKGESPDGMDKKKVKKKQPEDEFFDVGSDNGDEASEQEEAPPSTKQANKTKKGKSVPVAENIAPKAAATSEELALLIASDNPNGTAKHFDMNSVLKSEKTKGRKHIKGRKGKPQEEITEHQEHFSIDVKDDRFQALHEDHAFAIDPSNPHFKKTKSMAALLGERSKRQKVKYEGGTESDIGPKAEGGDRRQKNLQSLVESVKRKSTAAGEQNLGKRRKL